MSDENGYPAGWKPQEGDSVSGTVVSVEPVTGKYGTYPCVTVRTAEGDEIAIHAFHDVLRGNLAERRPGPGDHLWVKYLGYVQAKNGTGKYHSYRVRGGKAAGYDWNQDLPEDQRVTVPPQPVGVVAPDVPIAAEDLSAPATADTDDLPF